MERTRLIQSHLSNATQVAISKLSRGHLIRSIGSGHFLTTGKGDRGRTLCVVAWREIQPYIELDPNKSRLGIKVWRLKNGD